MCQVREQDIDCYYPPSFAIQPGQYIGAMQFEFIYSDNVPDEMKAACEYVGRIWGSVLASDVACRVAVRLESRGRGNLASASNHTWHENGVSYPASLAQAMKGQQLYTTSAIISIRVNSDQSWYFGLDGQDSTRFDFVTVFLHELGHGLGFTGHVRAFQNDIYPTGYAAQVTPHIFPSQYIDGQGIDLASYQPGSKELYDALFSNRLRHKAGGRVFNPNPVRSGSSWSHFNEGSYAKGTPDALMTPYFSKGEAIHEISELTRNTLYAMGWTAPEFVPDNEPAPETEPEPEPETTLRPADYTEYSKEDGVMLFEAEADGVYTFNEKIVVDGQEIEEIALSKGLHKITIPNLYFNVGTQKYDNIMSRHRAMMGIRGVVGGGGGGDPVSAVYLEAENANEIGSQWAQYADASASNGFYMSADAGVTSNTITPANTESARRIRFSVNLVPGTYSLFVRAKTGIGGGDNSCFTAFNDVISDNLLGGNDSTFSWITRAGLRGILITEESNTIDLYIREAGFQIDRIYFTSLDDSP